MTICSIFIALVLGLSYLIFWGPIALLKLRTANLVEGKIYNLPAFIFFLIGGFVPSIVGISLTKIYDHKSGLKDLLKSAIDFKIGFQPFVIIVTYPIIIGILQLIINRLLGGSFDYSQFLKQLPSILPLIILGPLSEEFGWRGYALPRLQAKFNALVSSLILGFVWAVWHIPQFLIPGNGMFYKTPFLTFVPTVIAATVLFTWVFNNTRGSLLAMLFLHTTMNYSFFVLPALDTSLGYVYVLSVFAIAAVVVAVLRAQMRVRLS
jgi:membrane protease YdiL (CAAX protease family)